ncbi:MAG: hypothetical protein CMD88_02255 [Gammaproteobacteria bacterium]|nr:hypothetical protein [Gammaproteobacteria bacterium]|tara:strand:+ start:129 stop:875 length:747 start_codon:yes stop_codon:yes gene_type:complete
MNNIETYKNKYKNNGYFIVKDVFDKNTINKVISEIDVAQDVQKYTDKKGNLRRIERLYDKGIYLKKINSSVLSILKKIFDKDFTIFKDKCNSKPPGGEGFFAHYDGIFLFKNNNGKKEKGWYKYTDFFINVLIALDDCNKENGTIEISNAHSGDFDQLLLNTKQNGTPDILNNIEQSIDFEPIELKAGDLTIFSNTCPHRSKKNESSVNRRTLYYTYTLLDKGSYYHEYFIDKSQSKNLTSKSLSGES